MTQKKIAPFEVTDGNGRQISCAAFADLIDEGLPSERLGRIDYEMRNGASLERIETRKSRNEDTGEQYAILE